MSKNEDNCTQEIRNMAIADIAKAIEKNKDMCPMCMADLLLQLAVSITRDCYEAQKVEDYAWDEVIVVMLIDILKAFRLQEVEPASKVVKTLKKDNKK